MKLLEEKPDLIIWPETAIPLLFDVERKDYSEIKRFAGAPLVTGTHLYEVNNRNKFKIYNSLLLLSDKSEKVAAYNKEKLVPFIEDAPVPIFNIVLNAAGYQNFSSGTDNKLFEIGKIKALPSICYEAIIPHYIRNKLKDANLIINATNDSWYGQTIEPKMHLYMSAFRAIENRRALVRATCTGYSAVFNPNGDILYESGLFVSDAVNRDVSLYTGKTIYNLFGYLFVWILALFIICLTGLSYYRKVKYKNHKAGLIKKSVHKKNLNRMWID
jgi:apolipoprotein N-acyltransferase